MRWWPLSIPFVIVAALWIERRLRTASARPPASAARSRGFVLAWLVFVGVYALVLAFFASVDVYHDAFYRSGGGLVYLAYGASRAAFSLYLVAMLYGLGSLMLALLEHGRRLRIGALDRFILGFFVGSAVLHLLFQPLGFANLYRRGLLIALSLPLVAISFPMLYELWRHRRAIIPRLPELDGERPRWAGFARGLLIAASALTVLYLVLMKGLQPHAVTDVATHYFPYYRQVAEMQGVWPNDVWYHFFHSRGASAVFLSVGLTDVIGAQLASCSYVLMSALVVMSLVRFATGSRWWSITAATLYLGGLTVEWSWASFEKQHVIMMSLLLAQVWALSRQAAADTRARGTWTWVSALIFVNLILFVSMAVFPLVALLLGLLALNALLRGRSELLPGYVLVGVAGSASLVGGWAVNHALTGMADFVPFRIFWHFADQQTFSGWMSPYLVQLMVEGSSPGLGGLHRLVLDEGAVRYWHEAFRLKSLRALCPHPYLALPLIGFATLLFRRGHGRKRMSHVAAPVAFLCLACFVTGQAVNQPVSMFRFFVFTLPLMALALTLAWDVIARSVANPRLKYGLGVALPALVCAITFVGDARALKPRRFVTALRFVTGTLSFSEAYEKDGSYWPPAQEVAQIVGAGGRVWTMNAPFHLNMAPEPRLEGFLSYGMGKEYHEVLFENGVHARQRLHEAGLDFFLVDATRPLFDVLPHAPLFRPESIRDHLALAWQDGDVFLLTWKSAGTKPLSDEFMESYARAIEASQSGADWRGLYARVRDIYRQSGAAYPLRIDPDAPPLRGFQ